MKDGVLILIIATILCALLSIVLQISGMHDPAMFMITLSIFNVLWLIYQKL